MNACTRAAGVILATPLRACRVQTSRAQLCSSDTHTAVVPGPVPGTHWPPCSAPGEGNGSRHQVPGRQSEGGKSESPRQKKCECRGRSETRRGGKECVST